MPKSHICPSCLTELARIRAVPDPHYGLAVVVCPKCSLACVRTKHPDRAFWRGVGQGISTMRALVFRLFLLASMTLLLLFATGVLANAIERADRSTQGLMIIPLFEFDPYGVLPAGVLAMIAGCVIRLAFGHHRAWVSLSVLYGSALGVVLGFSLYELVYELIRLALGLGRMGGPPTLSEWMTILETGVGVGGFAALGLIPARILHPYVQKNAHRRYCKARKMIRRRQSRTD